MGARRARVGRASGWARNALIMPLESAARRGDGVCSPRSTSSVGRWCGGANIANGQQ